MTGRDVSIGGRRLGETAPVYVVAEAGVNHNGDVGLALELVKVAAAAGADAVKFQAFDPSELCAREAPLADYQAASAAGAPRTQREMLEALALPADAFRTLKSAADRAGVDFLCAPFDPPSLDLVLSLDAPAIKFASTELGNDRLLARAAASGKTLVLSTGAATPEEVERALAPLAGSPIVLLHCVSAYPTNLDDLHLATIPDYRRRFGRPVGFSDHAIGDDATPIAVALGAVLIEKHFTTSRQLEGPDQALSLEPAELARYVEKIRSAERAIGSPRRGIFDCERNVRDVAGKSLTTTRPLGAGEIVRDEDLTVKRPGTGVEPGKRSQVVGRRTTRAVGADVVLTWDLVEGGDQSTLK